MLTAENIQNIYPLSPMQEGMYFHYMLNPESGAYIEQTTYLVNEQLNATAMETAFHQLVDRHEILRTVFNHKKKDRPLQVVLKKAQAEFSFIDLENDSAAELESLKKEERHKGFDLEKQLPMRLVLAKKGTQYAIVWTYHHILMDGWCMQLLVQDFNSLYQAALAQKPANLPEAQPYSLYVKWLTEQDPEKAEAFWAKRVGDIATNARIPVTLNEGNVDYDHQIRHKVLDESSSAKLAQLARDWEVTPGNLMHSLWGLMLCKWQDTEDAVFGSVVSGKPASLNHFDRMVGLFINTVPYVVSGGNERKVSEVVRQCHKKALEADEYQYASLARTLNASPLGRALFNHIFIFNNIGPGSGNGSSSANDSALEVDGIEVIEQTNYDLNIVCHWQESLVLSYNFNRQNISDETIDLSWQYLSNLIEQLVAQPEMHVGEYRLYRPHELILRLSTPEMDLFKNCSGFLQELASKQQGLTTATWWTGLTESQNILANQLPGRLYYSPLKQVDNKLPGSPQFNLHWTSTAFSCEYVGDLLQIRGLAEEEILIGNQWVNLDQLRKPLEATGEFSDLYLMSSEGEIILFYLWSFEAQNDEIEPLLHQCLPAGLMPQHSKELHLWPQNPDGTANTAAFEEMARELTQAEQEFVAPQSPVQQTLANIWQEVLGQNSISINDNFFRISGDSLRATRIISKMKKEGLDVQLRDIFEHPTIRGLAEVIEDKTVQDSPTPEDTSTLIL